MWSMCERALPFPALVCLSGPSPALSGSRLRCLALPLRCPPLACVVWPSLALSGPSPALYGPRLRCAALAGVVWPSPALVHPWPALSGPSLPSPGLACRVHASSTRCAYVLIGFTPPLALPSLQNDVSEKEQRKGAKTIEASTAPKDAIDINSLRQSVVKKNEEAVKAEYEAKYERPDPKHGGHLSIPLTPPSPPHHPPHPTQRPLFLPPLPPHPRPFVEERSRSATAASLVCRT